MDTAKYATLAEWREGALRMPQAEVARKAGCKQGWISQVERGHLPRSWNRDKLLMAYGLVGKEAEFERMILAAAKLKALSTPAAEDTPLFAQPNIDNKTDGKVAILYDKARVLGQTEVDRMKQRINRIWRQA